MRRRNARLPSTLGRRVPQPSGSVVLRLLVNLWSMASRVHMGTKFFLNSCRTIFPTTSPMRPNSYLYVVIR